MQPHPDHDAILRAFLSADPACRPHTVGGHNSQARYTHIHSASQQDGVNACTSHQVIVHQFNGAVCLRRDLAGPFGLDPRPSAPIAEHPLGYGGGPEVGDFDHGLTAPDIFVRWRGRESPTLERDAAYKAFVQDVVNACKARGLW
jgi:hypothetical protein